MTKKSAATKKLKRILALVVTLLFVGGLIAGLLLLDREQDYRSKATDSNYLQEESQ